MQFPTCQCRYRYVHANTDLIKLSNHFQQKQNLKKKVETLKNKRHLEKQ